MLPVITNKSQSDVIYHFMGIYLVGFLSSLAAAIAYFLYIRFSQQHPSFQHFSFVCICGADENPVNGPKVSKSAGPTRFAKVYVRKHKKREAPEGSLEEGNGVTNSADLAERERGE